MLQQDKAQDFVIATGIQASVRQFVDYSAQVLGWGSLVWTGTGLDEVGIRPDTNEVVVRVDPSISGL